MYKSAGSNSTGGAITVTAISNGTLNNLFDDVTAAEASAGATEYRKGFWKNNNASITLRNTWAWRSADTTSPHDELYLGLGTALDDDGANELTDFSGAALVSIESDGADTRSVVIVGTDASGERATETLTLNGTTPVLSVGEFRHVHNVSTTSDADRTITIKEGDGGTSRGTIAPTKLSAILYVNANNKTVGIPLGDIAPAGSTGLWIKRIVTAGAAALSNDNGTIKCEGETT